MSLSNSFSIQSSHQLLSLTFIEIVEEVLIPFSLFFTVNLTGIKPISLKEKSIIFQILVKFQKVQI
jgi:hypothetical protein